MRGIPFAFFLAATLCATAGMIWGIQMSVIHDHNMSPAHAHLNLVGWVTLALFGLYYHVTPQAASSGLARVHVGVAIVGVVVFVVGLVIVLQGGQPFLVAAGSLLTVVSMVIFLWTVLRHGFGGRIVEV